MPIHTRVSGGPFDALTAQVGTVTHRACAGDCFCGTTGFLPPTTGYTVVGRFQGAFLYLDRNEYGQVLPICRLRYRSASKCWDFAIYKYSSERYDAHETWFPGFELVDGTVEGAMKAGMRAYQ